MPNWCTNRLEVTGPVEERHRFLAAITVPNPAPDEERYRILARIVPMPEALEGTTSPSVVSPAPNPNWATLLAEGTIDREHYDHLCADQVARYEAGRRARAETGYGDWYEWQRVHWGVKWGDCSTEVEVLDDSLNIRFDTPWGPPETGLRQVSARFPNLLFVLGYIEEGMQFLGAATFREGQVVNEATEDYPTCPDYDEDDGDAEIAAWEQQHEDAYDALDRAMTEVL